MSQTNIGLSGYHPCTAVKDNLSCETILFERDCASDHFHPLQEVTAQPVLLLSTKTTRGHGQSDNTWHLSGPEVMRGTRTSDKSHFSLRPNNRLEGLGDGGRSEAWARTLLWLTSRPGCEPEEGANGFKDIRRRVPRKKTEKKKKQRSVTQPEHRSTLNIDASQW